MLTSFCLFLPTLQGASTQKKQTKHRHTDHQESLSHSQKEEGYTINFENIPILELIKFISKIGDLNFIYEEKDLNFNVSLVSQEPVQVKNIVAALIQVLRLNGLDIIEQGTSVVISRGSIKQIATVVSPEVPLEGQAIPPMMTRVFRVKNTNPQSLAKLIGPLLSPNAILEVSEETRHLILTDITQNIQEIDKLFSSLDIPQTSLTIDSFSAQNQSPQALVTLATQILTPISQGNPLIFVPQLSTNMIFIVSTPFLIEKAIETLEDLDQFPSLSNELQGPLSSENILLYSIKYKPADLLQSAVKDVTSTLNQMGPSAHHLTQSLQSMKFIKQSHSLLFTGRADSLREVKRILEHLDIPYQEKELEHIRGGFYLYKIKQAEEKQFVKSLEKLVDHLKKGPHPDQALIEAIESMQAIPENYSVVFTGDQQALDRLKEILPTLDHKASASQSKLTYSVYPLKKASGNAILKQLGEAAKSIQSSGVEADLIEAIQNIRWIQSSNSLIITGPASVVSRIESMIQTFDSSNFGQAASSFYVYKPVGESAQALKTKVISAAKEMEGAGLDDPALIATLNSASLVFNETAILFTGTAIGIEKVKQIVATFDTVKGGEASEFYFYKPQFLRAETLIEHLKRSAIQFKSSGLKDPDLIHAMESAHLTEDKQRIIFTGTVLAIEKVKVMAQSYDNHEKDSQSSHYYIFKPQHQPPEGIIKQAKHAAQEMEGLKLADRSLIAALNSATVVSNQTAVLFTGTEKAIARIQQIAPTFDILLQEEGQRTQYYIFKPKYQSPQAIIKQANHASFEMRESGLKDPNLIAALSSATVVSNGTGVLFTGTQGAIMQIKEIVLTLDTSDGAASTPKPNEFYVYKPIYVSAEELRKHAQTVAEHIESSGFADQALIQTLKQTRLVSNGKSVLFTGTQTSIAKIQDLLPFLDSSSEEGLKEAEKTTFTIYKIQHLTGPVLLTHLKNMVSDLQRAGSTQNDLIKTLNHIRYVQDTNSLILTGSPSAVEEAIQLAKKFDTPDLAQATPTRAPSGYLIYNPKSLPGEELIKILKDFEQNLVSSGISDQPLFDVISNLKWMEKTSSILVSGSEEETKKVYAFLERFDVPSLGTSNGDTMIETISETSFLIYKLQYHSGAEIQDAIKLIGSDLQKSNTKASDALTQTINTLQWIQVTNSLIATGQPESLTKLKELIKSVDVPLKQIFVEVLVIETTMSNNLQFGLRWGSQGKLLNKFGYATGVFPQSIGGSSDPLIKFQESLATINGKNTLTGSYIPFAAGGDLGVIGDIILHKGQSYFALGSLINAIKDEGDSVIVMNQKIVAQDNKTSTIFVGQNIPYTGSTVTNQGQTITTAANLEYRDVGVSLKITPVVGNSDVITLMIEEDISEKLNTPNPNVSNNVVHGITTSRSSTKTVVSVPDKSFFVLSGSMQDAKTYHRTGVPCLGGLPWIGAAFSDQQKNENLSNLIIFVRPHIIKSFQTYQEITDRQEELYRNQTVEEDFDAGLELVKTPDDVRY